MCMQHDARIASFFYENGIAFNVADSTSFVCIVEVSMKFAIQNPLQSVQSQVIASSCEQNWSAHWHIHTKIRNRLEPATTEKLDTFTQTAKWWRRLAMPTNSKCLLGILKMLER